MKNEAGKSPRRIYIYIIFVLLYPFFSDILHNLDTRWTFFHNKCLFSRNIKRGLFKIVELSFILRCSKMFFVRTLSQANMIFLTIVVGDKNLFGGLNCSETGGTQKCSLPDGTYHIVPCVTLRYHPVAAFSIMKPFKPDYSMLEQIPEGEGCFTI